MGIETSPRTRKANIRGFRKSVKNTVRRGGATPWTGGEGLLRTPLGSRVVWWAGRGTRMSGLAISNAIRAISGVPSCDLERVKIGTPTPAAGSVGVVRHWRTPSPPPDNFLNRRRARETRLCHAFEKALKIPLKGVLQPPSRAGRGVNAPLSAVGWGTNPSVSIPTVGVRLLLRYGSLFRSSRSPFKGR